MFPHNVTALRADALFVSALQRSDELSPGQIRQAMAAADTSALGRKPVTGLSAIRAA
jgi:hypothetical protein